MKKNVLILSMLFLIISMNFTFAGQWIKNGEAWMYDKGNGEFYVNEQKNIDGKWYYFDEYGCMLTGYQQIDDKFYVFNEDGTPKTDPITFNGKTYNVTPKGKINKMTEEIFEELVDSDFVMKNGSISSELAYAKSLLNLAPMSKRALHDVLITLGMTEDKVEFVIANIGILWKDQALKCAKKYIEYRRYNKPLLKSILKLEQFNDDEIQYALENAYFEQEGGMIVSEQDKISDMSKYMQEMLFLAIQLQNIK